MEKVGSFVAALLVFGAVAFFAAPNPAMKGAWCSWGYDRYCVAN